MAGEVGGVPGVVAADVVPGPSGKVALFSTSADMVLSEPQWTSGRSGIKQAAAP